MTRPLRIEYKGAIYHVTSRGIDRRIIFNDEKDYQHFIQLLKEGADFFRVEMISYCLMNNHFHLLLSTGEANLSRFMQRLNVAYTRYFNYKNKRVGPLMQGRYKAILVGSDEYLLVLSRYIHLNPIKINSVRKKSRIEQKLLLRNYKWSSYNSILSPCNRSDYFKCEKLLDYVGGDNEVGRKEYERYVIEGIEKKIENPMDALKYQFVIGSDKFIEKIKQTFIKDKDLKPFKPKHREINHPMTIQEIAEAVSVEYGVSAEEMLVYKSKHKEARQMLIELSYRINLHHKRLRELGKELGGLSGSGVARVHERVKTKMTEDKLFSEKIARLMLKLS